VAIFAGGGKILGHDRANVQRSPVEIRVFRVCPRISSGLRLRVRSDPHLRGDDELGRFSFQAA
jgi:hypothetical protein